MLQPSMVYNLIHTGNQPSISPNSLSLLSLRLNSTLFVLLLYLGSTFLLASMTLLLSKVSCVIILRIVVQLNCQRTTLIDKTMIYDIVYTIYFTSIEYEELMLHLFSRKSS